MQLEIFNNNKRENREKFMKRVKKKFVSFESETMMKVSEKKMEKNI